MEQLFGIDVSHWQGDVDWFRVAQSGVSFAFTKATEGSTGIDATFQKNWDTIREAGLFRGTYHFARPGGDPETQAAHFAAVVGELGFRDLPPVLDLEVNDGHPAEHVLAWARAFIDKAETIFRRTLIIYTGGFWLNQLKNHQDPYFGARPLWLAAYRAKPVVPKSWGRSTFWQFSDGSLNGGKVVPGVRGHVDQNWFFGDETELSALVLSSLPAPPPAPSLVPAPNWPGVHLIWRHTPPISGPFVRDLQERLNALGFAVDTDGVYGPQTKAACIAFQRERGLVADGIVGPATWKACFTPG